MPRAAILAFDACYASSACGFADILQVANAHLRYQQAPVTSLFEWHFISEQGGPVTASNGLLLPTRQAGPDEVFDLVFIPGLHYDGWSAFAQRLAQLQAMPRWLQAQWQAGAWLAANCTGTFVLAETGLLDHRAATTTWWLANRFRSRYPTVDLQLRSVLTESERLICAGASASYLLQTVRIVACFCGAAIASQTARSLLIDVSQTSQVPYLPLLAEYAHTDSLVHRAQNWLAANLANEVRMSELAAALAVSDRTLIRRFRAALNQSPLAYLQDIRLEAARRLLESGDQSVEVIAAQVGYRDTSSFSRLFRERIGLSPGAYRSRLHINAAS